MSARSDSGHHHRSVAERFAVQAMDDVQAMAKDQGCLAIHLIQVDTTYLPSVKGLMHALDLLDTDLRDTDPWDADVRGATKLTDCLMVLAVRPSAETALSFKDATCLEVLKAKAVLLRQGGLQAEVVYTKKHLVDTPTIRHTTYYSYDKGWCPVHYIPLRDYDAERIGRFDFFDKRLPTPDRMAFEESEVVEAMEFGALATAVDKQQARGLAWGRYEEKMAEDFAIVRRSDPAPLPLTPDMLIPPPGLQ